jgi:Na+/melibiose symporter-like transporter
MQKFNIWKTFLLGFGFFGVSVIWSVYNAFVPVFLEERFAMAAGFIGMFMTMDNVAALFIQPVVGAYSDSLRTRLGRRLPFILIGAPIAAIAFIVLPLSKVLPVFFISCVVLLLSMALWRTPVVALMPDITQSKYRSQANGIINFMGGLGTVIAFIVGAKLYDMDPVNHAYPFWLGSILVILGAGLVLLFVREPKTYEKSEETPPNIVQSLKAILNEKDKNTLLILGAIFFWFISYCGIEAFFTLFGKFRLHIPVSDGARLLSQLSLVFLIFALPAGYIGSAFGRRRTILTGLAIMIASLAVIFFIPPMALTKVFASVPLIGKIRGVSFPMMAAGLGWAFININSLPMVVDMTDESHIGTFTGLYYMFSTLAAILGPTMYGWIVTLSGNMYSLIMMVSPFFMICAFVCMVFVKRGEAKTTEQTAITKGD